MIRVLLDWRSLRFKRELNTRFEEQNEASFLDYGYVIIVIKSFVILPRWFILRLA